MLKIPPESLMRVLRDCGDMYPLWNHIIKIDHWSKFFSLGTLAWLEWNLSTNDIGNIACPWKLLFGFPLIFCGEIVRMSYLINILMLQILFGRSKVINQVEESHNSMNAYKRIRINASSDSFWLKPPQVCPIWMLMVHT
jgi:hypothetical protein